MPRFPRALAIALLVATAAASCDDPPIPTFAEPSRSPSAPPTPTPAASDLPADAITGRLAFSSETPDASDDLFLLDLADPEAEPIRLTTGQARDFDPDLSPDGERIAWRINPDEGSDAADIWLAGADGSEAVNLTGDPSRNNWSPAWAPDGERIAFASTRERGIPRIWTMAPDGTDLRLVSDGHGEYPDWAPDGERIVYAAPPGASGRYGLWLVDADGGPPERLTAPPTTDFAPAWSPDGAWIAFQRDAISRWELWVVRPDGSDEHRVSPDDEDGVWPAWGPDGLLAWSGTQGLSFLDLDTNARRSFMPARPGTDFLSWGP